MGKWTKKDIKVLCGTIDTFWLQNRPLAGAFGLDSRAHDAAVQKVRETLAAKRVDVVLAGIRSFERLYSERYKSICEAIGNEIARFRKPLEDEFVQRFVKLARETDADSRAATALRERIQREGLPPEVEVYDPIK